MESKFRISENDYVKAMRLSAKLSRIRLWLYFVAAVGLAILAIYGGPIVEGGAIGGLIGGSVVAVARYLISPVVTRRHYRKYKGIHGDLAVELLDDGIRYVSEDAEGKLKWDKIFKWRFNEEFILIYPMPRLYYIVPRVTEASGFNVTSLMDHLSKHVGPAS